LLGTPENGRWQMAPVDPSDRATRRYRGNTLILETVFKTATGSAVVIDFMSRRDGISDLVRIVRGLEGTVSMRSELVVRFDYGSIMPWVTRQDDGRLRIIAGPDRLVLDAPIPLHGENMHTVGDFEIEAGQENAFTLSWTPSFRADPPKLSVRETLQQVEAFWTDWASGFKPDGEWSDAILRSLLTLKALTHWETGGIVAAGTTSVPEFIGGSRNWDYRFCWLRDATFTLYALMESGFLGEATTWRDWLLRAVAGSADHLQIMYGIAGERRLEEYEIPWLPGYEGSLPVRVGNLAAGQLQLDVYGEVLDALYVGRRAGFADGESSWSLECAMIAQLEQVWSLPDDGIWEVRGGRKHFTFSKVMAWVAVDRAIRTGEEFGLRGPLDSWRRLRDAIHDSVCTNGVDPARNCFVQSYGSTSLDASLLLIPLVGFLPPDDPRIAATVAAIQATLMHDGLVLRYRTHEGVDGLPPGEGVFLACSFWLADNLILLDRIEEARALFERLLALCNDVGLLAEEYEPRAKRQVGNFPQAFSHLALIDTALNLTRYGPAHERGSGSDD
jgi:GH15 family glucan-1,4-alpha-glucosidase